MADATDFDLSQLTSGQQASLQQYTDVTGQEIKDAVPLLQRSQWNLEVCLSYGLPSPLESNCSILPRCRLR